MYLSWVGIEERLDTEQEEYNRCKKYWSLNSQLNVCSLVRIPSMVNNFLSNIASIATGGSYNCIFFLTCRLCMLLPLKFILLFLQFVYIFSNTSKDALIISLKPFHYELIPAYYQAFKTLNYTVHLWLDVQRPSDFTFQQYFDSGANSFAMFLWELKDLSH